MGKPKPSAYVFYMQEQKRLVPGWKNKSNQELVGLCDKGWTSLSPKEKKRYEDMKEEAKSRDMGTGNQGRERRKGDVRIEGGSPLNLPILRVFMLTFFRSPMTEMGRRRRR